MHESVWRPAAEVTALPQTLQLDLLGCFAAVKGRGERIANPPVAGFAAGHKLTALSAVLIVTGQRNS